MLSDVFETHNHLINGWDRTRPDATGPDWTQLDFLQPIIPTLLEDLSRVQPIQTDHAPDTYKMG